MRLREASGGEVPLPLPLPLPLLLELRPRAAMAAAVAVALLGAPVPVEERLLEPAEDREEVEIVMFPVLLLLLAAEVE